jgi:hypothetical protein
MTLKLAGLYDAMENIRLRIGQELTLVDGMNYKIYVLNTDIVVDSNREIETEADTEFVGDQKRANEPRKPP